MENETVEDLCDEIILKRKTQLKMEIQRSPRNNIILSDIGDCVRQMVYGVLDYDKREMWDEEVQARLEVGKEQERKIVSMLLNLGYDIILQQNVIEIKDRLGAVIARGRTDGDIKRSKSRFSFPFEIKSMNPNVFNSIKSLDDLRKKPWLRKYIRQLMMYLYGNNKEVGLLILTDCLGHIKLLPLYLDYGEAEITLKRIETAADFIKRKEYPDRIIYDQSICGMCSFRAICLQDIINNPAELIDNPEFEAKLDRLYELKPISKEYDEIYDEIKELTVNIDKLIVSDKYILQNVPSQRTTYEIPDEVKALYSKKIPVKRLTIEILEKKG